MTEHEQMLITKYDLLFESRLTKVETSLGSLDQTMQDVKAELKDIRKDMKSDFKWLFGLMLAFSTVLVGMMVKGFHWYQ